MRKLIQVCSLAVILISFSTSTLRADDTDAERGRLPDGRAYRTDNEGNQLVDYIAELELEKEGLESRIFKLQDQVREVRETKSAPQTCPACPAKEDKECPAISCPAVSCPKIEPASCPKVETATFSCPTCIDREDEINSLQKRLSKISTANNEIEAEKNTLVEQLGTCQSQTEEFESTSASLKESLDDLRKALSERDASLQSARAQISELRQEQRILSARADASAMESRASLRNARSTDSGSRLSNGALEAAKSQLISRVSEIKSQARARDEQFLRIDQRGKALQVKPSPLKTNSGFELKSAEDKIKAANSFRALSDISRELEALSRIVADDIRLGAKLAKK